jgi:hypothetical protein
MSQLFDMLILLVLGHFFVDFTLQSDTVARFKNKINQGDMKAVPWWYWMLSHASMSALMVYLITGNIICTLIEVITHFLIDTGKCLGYYKIHADQALHLVTRIILIIILT